MMGAENYRDVLRSVICQDRLRDISLSPERFSAHNNFCLREAVLNNSLDSVRFLAEDIGIDLNAEEGKLQFLSKQTNF